MVKIIVVVMSLDISVYTSVHRYAVMITGSCVHILLLPFAKMRIDKKMNEILFIISIILLNIISEFHHFFVLFYIYFSEYCDSADIVNLF